MNQKHIYIAKGRSSRPACSRYMGVRYDVASAPKNSGDRQGWGGTKSSYTHRLSVSLSQPSFFEKHLYCNILMFRIYEGMKPTRTFVMVQYNSTLRMLGNSIRVLRP